MQLTVKNLGPISHAKVDLTKDLIILTGENNTGKTYLAYTIYSLFDLIQQNNNFQQIDLDLPMKSELVQWELLVIDLKEIVTPKLIKRIKETIIKLVRESLANDFVVNNDFFKDTLLHLDLDDEEFEITNLRTFDFNGKRTFTGRLNYEIFVTKEGQQDWLMINIGSSPSNMTTVPEPTPLHGISLDSIIFEFFLFFLLNKTFLIPAERQGINLFGKELGLIKNRTFDKLLTNGFRQDLFSFLQTRFNKFPKPIKKSLENAQNFDVYSKKLSQYAHLADELDKTFLNGIVQINEEGDIQFKPHHSNRTLEIHSTSSTVKSLATLSIYLRHLAKEGDFIIIDEPELNLHPDHQRKIARFLSRLVQAGFKVMISTHSDYIIKELNTLIMLNEGRKKEAEAAKLLMKQYAYKEEELLAKEKLGVYLFKVGEAVEEVEVSEFGFKIETIDEQIRQINEASQHILFSLFDY